MVSFTISPNFFAFGLFIRAFEISTIIGQQLVAMLPRHLIFVYAAKKMFNFKTESMIPGISKFHLRFFTVLSSSDSSRFVKFINNCKVLVALYPRFFNTNSEKLAYEIENVWPFSW